MASHPARRLVEWRSVCPARDPARFGAELETTRSIWANGAEVVRTIDSVHPAEPWDREQELINAIGRLAERAGPLTNAQTYALSIKINGVELRKCAKQPLGANTSWWEAGGHVNRLGSIDHNSAGTRISAPDPYGP